MDGKELKRCPFCGGDVIVLGRKYNVPQCTRCGARIPAMCENTVDDAITAWNKRTDCAAEATHELDRLRAELHHWKQRAHEAERKLARYKRERTIEDVLAEFAPKWVDTYNPDDKAALVDTYAAELRKLTGGDA